MSLWPSQFDVDNIYLNSGALRSSKLLILSTQLLSTSFASGLLKRSAIVNRILTALSNVCNSPSASTNPLPPALIFRSRSPTSSLLLNSLNELELLFVLKRTGLQFIFLLPVVLPIEAMIWQSMSTAPLMFPCLNSLHLLKQSSSVPSSTLVLVHLRYFSHLPLSLPQ